MRDSTNSSESKCYSYVVRTRIQILCQKMIPYTVEQSPSRFIRGLLWFSVSLRQRTAVLVLRCLIDTYILFNCFYLEKQPLWSFSNDGRINNTKNPNDVSLTAQLFLLECSQIQKIQN